MTQHLPNRSNIRPNYVVAWWDSSSHIIHKFPADFQSTVINFALFARVGG
jgi:hypothetical protein